MCHVWRGMRGRVLHVCVLKCVLCVGIVVCVLGVLPDLVYCMCCVVFRYILNNVGFVIVFVLFVGVCVFVLVVLC